MPQNNQLLIDLPAVDSYEVAPLYSLIKPEKVAVKRRDIQYSSSLTFRVNSSVIDPNLDNNRRELQSIEDMMESVVSDPDYTITGVNIIGYASPEGTLKSNQILSEKRAKALEAILKRNYPIDHNLYNVNFGGENWEALIPMVESSELKDKEKVLDIIKNVSIDDGRETKLMRLGGGVAYRYMLKNFFPSVRLVVVDVEYNVDAYDLVRIKELIDVKPQNLSLEEMYRLSETYQIESDEFTKVFVTAATVYPNDQVAIHNALVADLSKGNLGSAAPLAARLDHGSDSASILNSLGAYYMLKGDFLAAKPLLERAAALGNSDAKENLAQIEMKVKNLEQIKEYELKKVKIYGE